MKALLTAVLTGLGLFALLAMSSAQASNSRLTASILPKKCVQEAPQELVSIDIQGPIHQARDIMPCGTFWQITANGHTYMLDLQNSKTHSLKDGMTIRVTGQLVRRVYFSLLRTMEYPPRPRPPFQAWTVVADSVAQVNEKKPSTFARVKMRGTLNLNAPVGYPPQSLNIVTGDSQTVVLDLGTLTGLGMLKMEALNGKWVEVEGDITGFHQVTTMCVPGQQELPRMRVQKIAQVKLVGKLTYSNKPADPKWKDDHLPRWQLTVGKKTYTLEFDKNADLAKLAKQLEDNTVEITGTLQLRTYEIMPRPDKNGLRPAILGYRQVQVLVVQTMRV